MISLDWTFFLQAGIFLFLVVFLSKVLFKPVVQVLEAREQMHKGPAEQAAKLKKDVEELRSEVNLAIDGAKEQADSIRSELVSEARQEESKILAENRKKVEEYLGQSREEIRGEFETASKSLQGEADRIGAVLAEKLLTGQGGQG
jgi:F-type H+-transporting ATPase subunit b